MIELKRKLTAKQKMFCTYFIKYGNGTKAAIKAGYSKKTANRIASQNLSKVDIKKYIHWQLKRIDSRSIADSKELFQFYTKVVRAKLTEDSVGSDMDGYFKIKKRPDIKDRISAANELMKRYDPLVKAKIHKVNAESKIKELQAQENDKSANRAVTQTDTLLDKMENSAKSHKNK